MNKVLKLITADRYMAVLCFLGAGLSIINYFQSKNLAFIFNGGMWIGTGMWMVGKCMDEKKQ